MPSVVQRLEFWNGRCWSMTVNLTPRTGATKLAILTLLPPPVQLVVALVTVQTRFRLWRLRCWTPRNLQTRARTDKVAAVGWVSDSRSVEERLATTHCWTLKACLSGDLSRQVGWPRSRRAQVLQFVRVSCQCTVVSLSASALCARCQAARKHSNTVRLMHTCSGASPHPRVANY